MAAEELVPPSLIRCVDLAKTYARPLFSGLSLSIGPGERVGLIGPNGAGKSTLLRILAGEEEPDAGEVAVARGARIAYLAQEDELEPDRSVEEVVLGALEGDAGLTADERRTRARVALGKAGFCDLDQPAGVLSGGWRKRLALARVLAQDPDVVLMDEPTNHLDLSGIAWLERLLGAASFAWLVVTHDRYLLERVAARVVEIGRHHEGGFLSVDGSYSTFLLKREELLAGQRSRERSLANAVRREVEWLRRGPRGRGTKAKGRIDKAHQTMEELGRVRARNQALDQRAEIDFAATGRRTRELLRTDGLRVERGGRVLVNELELRLGPGDRLGLVGDNGCGKSTLLSVLAGELAPSGGTLERAPGLEVVTFHQDRARLDPEATLRETLCAEGDTVHYRGRPLHVTAWARRFQFDADQLDARVGALSGGEQARLLVADLVRQPADLLVLDEPTNDLDLATRELLEESLVEFPGALLLVTHDRYMLERVCTGLLGFDGRGEVRALADLEQWERMVAAADQAARARSKPRAAPAPARRRPGLTSREKREWEGMEDAIVAAEAEVERLQARVEEPEVLADHQALERGYADLHGAQQRVDALYARWEELEAKRQA